MPKRKTVLWTCCLTHSIQDGLSAAIYVLLPILAQVFGLTYAQVGLFKAVKNLAQCVLEVSSGFASERFGERSPLALGLVLAGTGYLLLSSTGAAGPVLACLVLIGVGSAFQHAPASALVSRVYASGGRRGALGLYNSSGDAGKLAFTAFFSLATSAGLAWQMTTGALGLTALAASMAVFALLTRSLPSGGPSSVPGNKDAAAGTISGWGILDKPGFAALLAVVYLDSIVQAGVLTFIAFAMLEKGVPLGLATLAAVAILVGGMCGKAACGFLAERIGVRPAFALIQVLNAIGIIAVVAAPSVLAYVLLPFLGIVLQGSTSITYGTVDDLIHHSRTSRGYGLVYASSSLAAVTGPLGLGLLADEKGIDFAMLLMAAVAALAIMPALLLRTGHPKVFDPV